MRILNCLDKWVFTLAALSVPLMSVYSTAFDGINQQAKNVSHQEEIDEVQIHQLTNQFIKTKIISFLLTQDTYLSFAAQLANNSYNGLLADSYQNQAVDITNAIFANANSAVEYLAPLFGSSFANQFSYILLQEASYFMSFLQCNLNGNVGCDPLLIAASWSAEVPPLYVSLLNTNPALDPAVLGFAQGRAIAQQEEAGLQGFGNSTLSFSEAFNSLQIHFPESIRNGVTMVQTSDLPQNL